MLPVAATRLDSRICQSNSVRMPALGRAAACAGIFGAALLLLTASAQATTYKWVDANGRIVYSDQRPTGNFKVEEINAPPPPANPNAAREFAEKEAEILKRRQQRNDQESKAAKARVEANTKREQCDKIQGQIHTLAQSDQIVIYTTNAKGERMPMDNAARVRERQQLEVWFRGNCVG